MLYSVTKNKTKQTTKNYILEEIFNGIARWWGFYLKFKRQVTKQYIHNDSQFKKKKQATLFIEKEWQLDGYMSECSSWISLKDELTGGIYFYFCVILHLCIFYNKHMLICITVMLRNTPNKTKRKDNIVGKNNLSPCPLPFLLLTVFLA